MCFSFIWKVFFYFLLRKKRGQTSRLRREGGAVFLKFFFYLQRCPSQKKFLFWRLFGKAEKFFFGWHNCPLRRRCAAADYIAGVSGFAASNVPLTTFLDNEKIKIVVKKQIGIATLKESVWGHFTATAKAVKFPEPYFGLSPALNRGEGGLKTHNPKNGL